MIKLQSIKNVLPVKEKIQILADCIEFSINYEQYSSVINRKSIEESYYDLYIDSNTIDIDDAVSIDTFGEIISMIDDFTCYLQKKEFRYIILYTKKNRVLVFENDFIDNNLICKLDLDKYLSRLNIRVYNNHKQSFYKLVDVSEIINIYKTEIK